MSELAMWKRKALGVAMAAMVSGAWVGEVHAGGGMAGGATEVTQVLNNDELILILGKNAQQLDQARAMVQNMLQHSQMLSQADWQTILPRLQSIIQALSNARGISAAAGNAMARIEAEYGNGQVFADYGRRVHQWDRNVQSQIAAVLDSHGLQQADFATTQAALQSVLAASQSSTSRMAVAQAGNQIAGMMVNELQNLQTTIMAAEQARLNIEVTRAAKEEQKRGQVGNFFRDSNVRW